MRDLLESSDMLLFYVLAWMLVDVLSKTRLSRFDLRPQKRWLVGWYIERVLRWLLLFAIVFGLFALCTDKRSAFP